MNAQKYLFTLVIVALVGTSTPCNARGHMGLALLGLTATGASATGAVYLEYQSVKDETAEKTWNRFGWDVLATISTPIFPLSFYCTYKAVEGQDWGKRLSKKLASRLLGLTTCISGSGTVLAAFPSLTNSLR